MFGFSGKQVKRQPEISEYARSVQEQASVTMLATAHQNVSEAMQKRQLTASVFVPSSLPSNTGECLIAYLQRLGFVVSYEDQWVTIDLMYSTGEAITKLRAATLKGATTTTDSNNAES